MKRLPLYGVLFLLTLLVVPTAQASKIKRGFEALKVYDYFKAKKNFSKGMKYNPSPGAFGLALIYKTDDNPFFSLDSAFKYVHVSRDHWEKSREGKKLRWGKYGWTSNGIDSLRNEISSLFFIEASKEHTVESYAKFIKVHPWSEHIPRAIEVRDSLAFFRAVNTNTAAAYEYFILNYPQSTYRKLAEDNFYDAQFAEITGDGSLASYIEFIELNPKNPLVPEAERRIYEIVTEPNTEEAYDAFIKKYPFNSFVNKAWGMLYQSYLANGYSKERLLKFTNTYPDYPFIDGLRNEIALCDSVFLPYSNIDSKFGFMNTNGYPLIMAQYQQLSPFHEGLAIVQEDKPNGLLGAINKSGELVIPFEFESLSEFQNGRSLVEKNGLYGMIHRNGHFVFLPKFEDLGVFTEGLVYANESGKYGYFDQSGRLRVPMEFEDAYDFNNGRAKVVKDGLQAYIDQYGAFVVPPVYEEIDEFNDSLFLYNDQGMMGLMNRFGKPVLEAQFKHIGKLNDGLALASREGQVFYINEQGEVAFENELETFPNYQERSEFKDGAAIAYKNEKYGRLNTHGKIITDFDYEDLFPGENVIAYKRKGRWGVMNLSNRTLISAKYDFINVVNDSTFIVETEAGIGVVGLNGRPIIPLGYSMISHLTQDIFVSRTNNLAGPLGLHRYGKIQVPHEYDRIGIFNEDFLILSKGSYVSYYDLKRDELINAK